MWELDHIQGWAPKNWCFWTVVFEKLESLGRRGDPTTQSKGKSVLNIHWKDWCRSWNSNTWATWYEELTRWKRPWCWEGLKAGEEGEDRGWDGRMASPTWRTWVWAHSGSWWRTRKPGVLQSTGSQRVRRDWASEQQPPAINGSDHGFTSLRAVSVVSVLNVGLSHGCARVTGHCCFNLRFPDDAEHIFICYCLSEHFIWWGFVKVFELFFNEVVKISLYILDSSSSFPDLLEVFSPNMWFPFHSLDGVFHRAEVLNFK